MEEGEVRKYKCRFCGRTSSSEKGILDHVRSKHTGMFVSKGGQNSKLYKVIKSDRSVVRSEPSTRPAGISQQPTAYTTVPYGQGLSASYQADVHNSGRVSPVIGFGNIMPNPSFSPVSGGFTLVPSGYDHMGQITYRLAPNAPPPPGFTQIPVVPQQPSFSQVVAGPTSSESRQSRPRVKMVTTTVPNGNNVPSGKQKGTDSNNNAMQERAQSRAPSAKGRAQSANPRQGRAQSAHHAQNSKNKEGYSVSNYHKVLTSEQCQCSLDFQSSEPGTKYRHMTKFHSVKSVILICRMCDCHFVSGQEFLGHIYNAHQDLIKERGYPLPQNFSEIEDSTPFVRVKLGSYLRLPYCKGCGYCHIDLFTKGLGCWCKSMRPIPGSTLDWKDRRFRVAQNVLPKMDFRTPLGKDIPQDWVCSKAGAQFVPPYANRNLASSAVSQPDSSHPRSKSPSPKAVSFPSDVEMKEVNSRESSPKASLKPVSDIINVDTTVAPSCTQVQERAIGSWYEESENPLPSSLQQPSLTAIGAGDGPICPPTPTKVEVTGLKTKASSNLSGEEGEVSSSNSIEPVTSKKVRRKKRKKIKKSGEGESPS